MSSISSIDYSWFQNLFILLKDIILDIGMSISPSVNYLFQARKFKKTKSSEGFSNIFCLVTILSHTLKVFFWFGERYKYALLIQSILVIIVQLYLIFLCVKFKENKNQNSSDSIPNNDISKKEKLIKIIKEYFLNWSKVINRKLIWRWDNIIEYYKFYLIIILILTIFSIIIGIDNYYYINIIGTLSIILEMLCSIPQIIKIHKTKNQKNISLIMVFLWLFGNSIKIYYNIYNNSPMQLIIGSFIQVFFNIILIIQIEYFYIINKKEANNNNSELTFVEEIEKKKEGLELKEEEKK
jgi:uncharacterized protein with PQ loop repeat